MFIIRRLLAKTPASLLGTALVAFSLSGCSVSSADLDTDSMWADISVSSDGSSSSVGVTLRRGLLSTTFIDLTDDDTLSATNNEETKELEPFHLLGIITYSTSFSVGAGGETFEVSLVRERDDGAPSSIATLPDRFTLAALVDPSPDEEGFSRENDAIELTWDSEGGSGDYTVSVDGECIDDYEANAGADATSITIAAGSIAKRTPEAPPEGEEPEMVPDECDVTISVRRTLSGQLDPAWMGGSISGVQQRSVGFRTVP